eukprot:g19732.t1
MENRALKTRGLSPYLILAAASVALFKAILQGELDTCDSLPRLVNLSSVAKDAEAQVEKLTSEDVHLLEAEAVLGKALKRLEQGGRQQALAAQEMLSFNSVWSRPDAEFFVRSPPGSTWFEYKVVAQIEQNLVNCMAPLSLRLNHAYVTGEKVSGITHHCCWPCICDTQSAVKTDTKEIQTASGAKSYTFLVIGDPCANSAKLLEGYKDPFTGSQVTLQEQAPEVTCVDNRLSGAHFSSRGHVIIGMYFVGDAEKEALPFNDASTFKDKCEARKEHGFGSGMGAIFQKVAAINPIVSPSFLQKWDAPTGSVDNQRLELALINIFGVVGAVGAALLIIMLARRQPKLNAGSDSEGAMQPHGASPFSSARSDRSRAGTAMMPAAQEQQMQLVRQDLHESLDAALSKRRELVQILGSSSAPVF